MIFPIVGILDVSSGHVDFFVSFVYHIDLAGKHRSVKTERSIWLQGNEVRWKRGGWAVMQDVHSGPNLDCE